ncbi:unnamed protein product, partial [Bubo scandiacus]
SLSTELLPSQVDPSLCCTPGLCFPKQNTLQRDFFKQQVELSRESSEPLPQRYYIEGTLQMVRVDHCFPGYGMNAQVHPDCPECCVVCNPGSYNPSNEIHCLHATVVRYMEQQSA